ncbi:N/A [soil metagenome]
MSRLSFPAGAVVVTGGAGFIGTNLTDRLLRDGVPVRVLDSLARPGVERNLRWLRKRHGDRLQVVIGDVRDRKLVLSAVNDAAHVYHLAAQVAVTSSLEDPRHDFEVNALGTLHVLEALRSVREPPALTFASTNKVYGGLEDVTVRRLGKRYVPDNERLNRHGIDEDRPLDFHSPYGCSKGAADQYVLDYARNFGLRATVLRMSCIYGPHQCGTEDQGWIAHFLIRAMRGESITVYGDGLQVRDVLFIDDFIAALLEIRSRARELSGLAFNIGGGPANSLSLLELLDLIAELEGRPPEVRFETWRPADQKYYVSDTARFRAATGWSPHVGGRTGVERLHQWLEEADSVEPARAARTA